jgi:hypothetical protein
MLLQVPFDLESHVCLHHYVDFKLIIRLKVLNLISNQRLIGNRDTGCRVSICGWVHLGSEFLMEDYTGSFDLGG